MNQKDYNKQFQKKSKKKLWIVLSIVAVLAIALTSVFFAQTTGDNQGYRTISVVEVSGRVSVVKDGIEYSAYPGMLLQEGHEIVTSSNSYVRLVLDDDKYVKLESGSRVIFETLGLLGSGKTRMNLERGSLTSELVNPLGEEDEFVVNTPNAVLAVRGTFFRVDLDVSKSGEVKADVMTYGGQVASQRVLPTGEPVQEEVLIDAGFKASINMTQKDTHYVVETDDGETIIVAPTIPDTPGDGNEGTEGPTLVLPTKPITTDDIPDEDLVDVFFAAENGHELFVTAEEVKTDLEVREIVIEEHKPVYEKAAEVKKEQEAAANPTVGTANTTSATVIANDSQPLAKVEEPKKEEANTNNNGNTTAPSSGTTTNTNGLVDGVHVHREKRTTVEATCMTAGSVTVTCRDCKETIKKTEIPALGHIYGDWVEMKAATCSEAGSKEHSCTVCGNKETQVVDLLAHNYAKDFTIDVEASCTADGSKSKHCIQCNETTEATVIPATGHAEVIGGAADAHSICDTCDEILSTEHTYTDTETKSATCTENGTMTHTCDCGYIYTSESIALGHDYAEDFTVDIEVTCTTNGSKSKHCSQCSDMTEVTVIPATGHAEVIGGTAAAHSICDICDEVISAEHTYTDTETKSVTCTESGRMMHTCNCGYTYTTEITATGHTEVAGGTTDVHSICDTCDEILSSEHEMTNTGYVAPSCTDAGSSTYTCDCGYTYTEEVVALGHNYAEEFTIDVEASCTTEGSKSKHCTQCSDMTEVTVIPATGHTEVAGGNADVHSICDTCGEILSTDHTYTDTETKSATCTEAGTMKYACDCGYTYTTEITATGHTEVAGATANAHCICDICDEILSTDHTYTDTETKSATCTENGTRKHACDCGYEYTSEITAVGHNYVAKTDEPTDSGNGRTYEECSNCGDIINESTILAINAINFPDENLRAFLATVACNTDGEAGLTEEEISAITSLSLNGSGVDGNITIDAGYSDLTGIEYLIALETLNISYNSRITTLDISQNPNLKTVIASSTGLTNITTTGCGQLQTLTLDYCDQLTMLDISENVNLVELDIHNSGVISLNPASQANYAVALLDVRKTGLSQIDFSKFYNVQILKVDADLVDLDLSECQNLTDLYISEGTVLSSIDVSNKANLRNIVFEGTTGITEIQATDLSLNSELDVSKSPNLVTLNLARTSISSIDLSQNADLETLTLSGNTSLALLDLSNNPKLSTLNVTDCSFLQFIEMPGTAVTSLDLAGCTMLSSLNVNNCSSLSQLDISGCTTLQSLDISATAITGFAQSAQEGYLVVPNTATVTQLSMSDTAINYSNASADKYTWFGALQSLNLGDAGVTQTHWNTISQYLPNSLMTLNLTGSTIETLDLSGRTAMSSLTLDGCTTLTTLDISDCSSLSSLDTSDLTALTTLVADGSGLTALDVTACTNITSVSVADCTALTEINASGCTKLTAIQHTDCTSLSTVDISGCTSFEAVSINSLTAIDTYNLSGCTSLTSFKAETGGSTLKTLNLSGCTSLTEVVLTAATELINLNIGSCSALTSIDISMLTNLEVFYANSAGIKTLSGNTTCLDFSSNPNLKEIQVNVFTSFTEVNLTANTKLEKFIYLSMPMTTVDFSNCVALQNFQTSGASVTSLDFSNCPEMIRIIATNSSKLTSLNVNGCTKLMDVRLGSSNNITSVDLTDTGSEVELGAYQEGKYLVFSVTSSSTTETSLRNATGWDSSKMSIVN